VIVRLGLAIAVLLSLAACGFEPLYAARDGRPAAGDLAEIRVNVIPDRIGQQLRNELLDRLSPRGPAPRQIYALDVKVNEARTELDLRRDATSTFAKLDIVADFRLTEIATGKVVLTGQSRVASSYNLLRQTFANISAAEDARARGVREISDDLRLRLAEFMAARKSS
jgi:LPS-assembly lipoprotein